MEYGFKFEPFGVTPDSDLIFRHKQFDSALSALEYGIYSQRGFVLVTGEIGAGKTTLMRSFLKEERDVVETAVILNPSLGPDSFLEMIAKELGIPVPRSRKRRELLKRLNDRFLSNGGSRIADYGSRVLQV